MCRRFVLAMGSGFEKGPAEEDSHKTTIDAEIVPVCSGVEERRAVKLRFDYLIGCK